MTVVQGGLRRAKHDDTNTGHGRYRLLHAPLNREKARFTEKKTLFSSDPPALDVNSPECNQVSMLSVVKYTSKTRPLSPQRS